MQEGRSSYVDPESGYSVFTRAALEARGRCCGCGCRHCPFQHASVPVGARADRIRNAAWLTEANEAATIALSWSGGKDSYLALRALQRQHAGADIVLFTTFDAETRVVAHQELPISAVVEQASVLGKALIGIPLRPHHDYFGQVKAGLSLAPLIATLAFGDLHLEHIRAWRESCFAPLLATGMTLEFPLWRVSYSTLMQDYLASGARSEVSAVAHPALEGMIGVSFGPEFVDALPDGVDAFGENGEFHTRVFPLPAD